MTAHPSTGETAHHGQGVDLDEHDLVRQLETILSVVGFAMAALVWLLV